MRISLIGAMAIALAACASIGHPEGGPRDETPPVFVRSNPSPGSVNVTNSKIDIIFDENIKVEDIANKMVVSPAQKLNPSVSANGRKISISLRDSLRDSTTYTIDFADAIRDLNEGNVLDGFATDFSTGPTIDTLRISGMVFQARNLEPAQGMVVGVYSVLTDSSLTTLPLDRVAKTNQYGQFTIRNLKPGTYRLFAIDDRNRDWHWDRSENIAFSSFDISPTVEPVAVADTLLNVAGEDSIDVRTAYRYLPDDLILMWFNEGYTPQYLRDYERNEPYKATFKFGAKSDSLPDITIVNGPLAGHKLLDLSVLEAREGLDSLVYWFRDSTLINQDSLIVAARYLKTDTLEQLSFTTDTLKIFTKASARKNNSEKKKEKNDTLPPPVPILDFRATTSGQQELNKPVTFESATPIAYIDSTGWRLEVAVDTVWHPVTDSQLIRDSALVRAYNLTAKWQPGAKYRFTSDSLAIADIYGVYLNDFSHEFTVKTPEDYGNIIFGITDRNLLPDSVNIVVELLGKDDKPVQTQLLKPNNEVVFNYIAPNTYYARAYVDRNRNGEWDTGVLADSIQPEDVFYFPKKIVLRKNWDINQEWSLFDTAVDLQKPSDIKKNKPYKRSADDNLYEEDGEEEEYENNPYGDPFYEQGSWGNGSTYNNAQRGNRSNTTRGGRQNMRSR